MNEILHTEDIKKKYSSVEKEIKRSLSELFLLNNFWKNNKACNWLSITKNFDIRELSWQENSKFLSNVSTIKQPTLNLTRQKIQDNLINLIEEKVDDKAIAEQYKWWIRRFMSKLSSENVSYIRSKESIAPKFSNYIRQSKNIKDIKRRNIKQQLAKILYTQFKENAFDTKIDKKDKSKEISILSQQSISYLYTLFYNANGIRREFGNNVDQVFHDWDFPFITDSIKATESDYIDAIIYLVDKWKNNFYWKRWKKGQTERSKKTSQYADILRALTNEQLRINESEVLWSDKPDFEWDNITKNLYKLGWGILENIIDTYNDGNNTDLKLHRRLKSRASCCEKIIEWKTINDTIWLRISTRWIWNQNFNDIKTISSNWLRQLKASLRNHPDKYVKPWEEMEIEWITIDNKWVLSWNQMDDIISELNTIIPTKKRECIESPYIDIDSRIERMEKHYPEIISDEKKWDTLQSFYSKISWWKARWRNGGYKDFKFNIVFKVKDTSTNSISTRTMEVQFDDVNNGKWLSNFHIRNVERRINTKSRLSFSVPLCNARKICEKELKSMQQWVKWLDKLWLTNKEKNEFFKINFDDGYISNISWFGKRTEKNSKTMDTTIVKILNYFLEKWTLILCDTRDPKAQTKPIIQWLLTEKDLHNEQMMNNLHFCSSLELASQQHSYLLWNRDQKIGIYRKDTNDIWWTTMWELIDPMNLWKKKKPQYTADI